MYTVHRPIRHSHSAMEFVRQSSVVSGPVLLSSDNSQSLSAAAQAGEIRNPKSRDAPFPRLTFHASRSLAVSRFTLHVLRFTIRSFVPLSPRMSKSRWAPAFSVISFASALRPPLRRKQRPPLRAKSTGCAPAASPVSHSRPRPADRPPHELRKPVSPVSVTIYFDGTL